MFTRKYKSARVLGSSLFALVLAMWSATSFGATMIGSPVLLSTLVGSEDPLVVGDKTFTGFGYLATGDMPPANMVNVVGIIDDDGNFGIRFQGAFIDLPSTIGGSDALITYMVEAGPNFLISDAHLAGNPNVLGSVGSISVTETFLPLGQAGEYTMEIFDDENTEVAKLVDWVDFVPPVKKLNVQKDILALALPNSGSVTMSMVDQTFSQVIIPEAITSISLMAGLVAIGLTWRGRPPRRGLD